MGVQINGDTGNVIATKGTFSGDVGIGGTLTYEDVTNIDAVGLITARSGIEIGARPGVAASISVDGNAIFSGITTVGSKIDVTNDTHGNLNAVLARGADPAFQLQSRNDQHSNSPRSGVGTFGVFRGDNDIVSLKFMRGTGATGAGSLGVIQAGVEKVRVAYTGHVGIGSTQPVKKLTIFSNSGDNGGILVQPNAEYANNTNRAYLIAGTAGWTGATTNWDTYGLQHRIKTNSTGIPRVTVDGPGGELFCVRNDGKIGIGTDEPSGLLHISSTGATEFVVEADTDNSNEAFNPRIIFKQDGHAAQSSIAIGGTVYDSSIDNALTLRNSVTSSGGIIFMTNNVNGSLTPYQNHLEAVERARFTPDGYFLFATKSQKNLGQGNTDTGIGLNPLGRINGSRDGAASILLNRNDSDGPIAVFYREGVQEGYINITTSGVSLANSSDYRLKENETTISDGITRVKQLIPRRFNFKKDSTTVDGFFAHEVSPVVPESVFGEKDAPINEEGDGYQGLDQSKLIPVLTASIKELIAKVETLEAEVAALKSN